MTHGVLSCVCLDCGRCLGFQVMHAGEGPSMVHDLLYSRFTRAPNVVVYDNACNLAVHCLMREPRFYADTAFLVDRMHYSHHRHCPRIYDANQYCGMQGHNTQAVEQMWSR